MGLTIDVHGLKLAYDAVTVLNDTEFKVDKGELVALLGANGAGKSTLLRCISRVLQPDKGQILLDGRDVEKLDSKEAACMMAVVPQETAADFEFTVEEIITMGRFPYLKRFQKEAVGDREIVQWAMEMTGVAHLAERSIGALSGGEKQRVVIARAICQQPEIMLLDEPTANLDIGYQSMLLELTARLNRRQGITVIAAIHDINLAVHHFNNFILLAGGSILAAGRADEVITPENIKKSYGVEATVFRHPLNGVLQVSLAKSDIHNGKDGTGVKIHVLGGGEEALPVFEKLGQAGLTLSVGPVSEQDSGCRFAHFHGLPVVILPPFTTMNENHQREHLKLLRRADAIVIPPIPFGEGNLPVIAQVETVVREGKKLYIVDPEGVVNRDYSKGKAVQMVKRLRAETGTKEVLGINDLLPALKRDGVIADD